MKTVMVAVAEPPTVSVTNVGFTVAPGPPETLAVRVTFPVKPFLLAIVIADVDEEPDGKVRLVGLADTLKSGGKLTVTTILAE